MEEHRRRFFAKGYCQFEGVVTADRVGEIRESVRRDVYKHTVLELPAGYVPGFLRFNQALAPYLAAQPILGFVESLFGPHARISMHTGMVNGPGIPRGELHADWPYNQAGAAHIPAPYPDCVLHLVTMWMLSDFTEAGGGTIVVPGSHRRGDHPRRGGPVDAAQPYPGEARLTGKAGSVVAFDARLWHAVAPNTTDQPRVAAIIRYAPWWLNTAPLRPGTVDRADIVEAVEGKDSQVPPLPREVFEKLPAELRPLLHHAVAGNREAYAA
jgi:ectoine hydroxylase-related dioxygenase (phytanoyl-CoA dioxygenase family)